MEYILINPESPEWNYIWEWVSKHPINEGFDTALYESDSSWQYTGSYKQGDKIIHSLRHRNHPRTNKLEVLNLYASSECNSDSILKKYKL